MVPARINSTVVRLHGAQGYNNAVKLLNDACSGLYGNGSTITARSIKEEDFSELGGNAWTEARANYPGFLKYEQQLDSAFKAGNSYYPSIYSSEKRRAISTNTPSETGLTQSQQTSLIGKTDNSAENGYKHSSVTKIHPVNTYYETNTYNNTKTLLGEQLANVLLPDAGTTKYWVASRCINICSNTYCEFKVHFVNSGRFYGSNLFESREYKGNDSLPLFPVVSLSSNLISGNTTSGFSVN